MSQNLLSAPNYSLTSLLVRSWQTATCNVIWLYFASVYYLPIYWPLETEREALECSWNAQVLSHGQKWLQSSVLEVNASVGCNQRWDRCGYSTWYASSLECSTDKSSMSDGYHHGQYILLCVVCYHALTSLCRRGSVVKPQWVLTVWTVLNLESVKIIYGHNISLLTSIYPTLLCVK